MKDRENSIMRLYLGRGAVLTYVPALCSLYRGAAHILLLYTCRLQAQSPSDMDRWLKALKARQKHFTDTSSGGTQCVCLLTIHMHYIFTSVAHLLALLCLLLHWQKWSRQ